MHVLIQSHNLDNTTIIISFFIYAHTFHNFKLVEKRMVDKIIEN